jgi:hypothetical protein
VEKARNDLSAAVPKFCLALEEHRRTPDGRVRTSQEFLTTFFPHDEKGCTDRLFKYLPNEVRGPIIAAWGVRGIKAALRDTDDKVQSVVHDAVVAGDVDHVAFEEGLTPETLVRWVPLADLWAFWRSGKPTKQAIHKALSTAFDLYLFDARWFLDALQAKGGAIKGTDVLADGLAKEDLTAWVRRIHEAGDGTPKGIVAALGWDKIVSKTANEVLVSVLDAVVAKVGLVVASKSDAPPKAESKTDEVAAIALPPLQNANVERAPADEGSWSMPPAAAPSAPNAAAAEDTGPHAPMSTEEAINVVLEDEVLFADPPPPSRAPAATPEVKPVPASIEPKPSLRDRPQWRPGGKR